MNCIEARDAMLVAELRDESTPLARHLRECEACRALSAMIATDLQALARAVTRRKKIRAGMIAFPIAAAIVGVIALGQSAAVLQTTDPRVTIVIITPEAEP
jgi:hypothetical protein